MPHSRAIRSWIVALGLLAGWRAGSPQLSLLSGPVLAGDLPASSVHAVPTVFRFSTAVDCRIGSDGQSCLARHRWVPAELYARIDWRRCDMALVIPCAETRSATRSSR